MVIDSIVEDVTLEEDRVLIQEHGLEVPHEVHVWIQIA